MDARTAEQRFKEADVLYREGRYDEALDRLIELDEAYPNTPNILFPLARCLRHVGRMDEALGICDDLITRCGDVRALELREFIHNTHSPAIDPAPHHHIHSIEGLYQEAHAGVLDDLLAPQPPAAPHVTAPMADSKPHKKYLLIGGGILLALLLAALPIVMRSMNGPPASHEPAAPRQAEVAIEQDAGPSSQPLTLEQQETRELALGRAGIATLIILIVVVSLAATTAALYLTLMLTGKLPYDTFVDNIINTGSMAVAISLLNFLPCLGLIIVLYILYKTYDFGLVDFLIWIGINVAIGFGLGVTVSVALQLLSVTA